MGSHYNPLMSWPNIHRFYCVVIYFDWETIGSHLFHTSDPIQFRSVEYRKMGLLGLVTPSSKGFRGAHGPMSHGPNRVTPGRLGQLGTEFFPLPKTMLFNNVSHGDISGISDLHLGPKKLKTGHRHVRPYVSSQKRSGRCF